jgi:hypothetical protein
MRGYPLDEIMGRLTFGESIYLLLMGEVPSPSIGSLMEAILVSFIDHGATPPSTLAARNTATTGRAAARVRGGRRARLRPVSWRRHRELHAVPGHGSGARAQGVVVPPRRGTIVLQCLEASEPIPGFGHRFHTRDPRAARLFQMALELEVEGGHIQMIRAVELVAGALPDGHALPVNIDGAIAAVCGDIGIPPRSPTRCSSSRASRASPRRRRKSASASTRCARSIRRITSTTAPASAACPTSGVRNTPSAVRAWEDSAEAGMDQLQRASAV